MVPHHLGKVEGGRGSTGRRVVGGKGELSCPTFLETELQTMYKRHRLRQTMHSVSKTTTSPPLSSTYSNMLTATLLAALVPLVAATPVARQDGVNVEALRTLAQAQDKYFGTAYQSFYLADERFEPILDGEFNQYTPENEMKWEVIQAERGVFNWTGSDLVRPGPWLWCRFHS